MSVLARMMREGARVTKPHIGSYYHRDADGSVCACAIGAALWASANIYSWTEQTAVITEMYMLTGYVDAKGNLVTLHNLITHMNDVLLMSREEIADWVEWLCRT